MQFLKTGLSLSRGAVYSLHKTSTRNVSVFISPCGRDLHLERDRFRAELYLCLQHIKKKASDWKVNMEVVAGDVSEVLFKHKCFYSNGLCSNNVDNG